MKKTATNFLITELAVSSWTKMMEMFGKKAFILRMNNV